jgi:hypothetical protein
MKIFILGFILITNSFCYADTNILTFVNETPEYSQLQSYQLDKTGQFCVRDNSEGTTNLPSKISQESNMACKYMMAAKEIKAAVGSCTRQVTDKVVNSYKTKPDDFRYPRSYSYKILSDAEGIVLGETYSILNSSVPQECMCGKVQGYNSYTTVNPLKLIGQLFDGSYVHSQEDLVSISSEECANMFPIEQRSIVLNIYKKYGLK